MIKEISIQNFQSHKKTKITLVNGLNVITGSSDSGKSSVLRALLWIVNNRPSGDSIKNWNCSSKDNVCVELFVDNFSISKIRTNGKSSYIFTENKKPSIYYDAIKTDVPEEIAEQLDLSEFNIQTQHQPYFLLNDSGGEVAKKLNDLVGLSIIDNLFKNINSSITRTDRELHNIESEIEEKTEIIKSLNYINDAENEIKLLERIIKEYNKLVDDYESIDSAIDRYVLVGNELRRDEKVLSTENSVSSLMETIKDFVEIKEDIDSLMETVSDLKKLERDTTKYFRAVLTLESEYKKLITENPVCPILKINCKELKNYGK